MTSSTYQQACQAPQSSKKISFLRVFYSPKRLLAGVQTGLAGVHFFSFFTNSVQRQRKQALTGPQT
jgi:hypothetical protein